MFWTILLSVCVGVALVIVVLEGIHHHQQVQQALQAQRPQETPVDPQILRQQWADYAAGIVQELNRANMIIEQIDQKQADEWIKNYHPRRCKHKRTHK